MTTNLRSQRSKKITMKILLRSIPPFLLLLCLCAPQENEEGMTELAKCIRDSEFVIHGKVGIFGSGMDGSLANIGFTIREVLKGNYTEAEVKFEQLPPGSSGGVGAFELFKAHGHDYIICFKKGAQEGKYEYCGPSLNSREIIANGANMAKAKRIIRSVHSITWLDTALPWWVLVIVGFVLLAATVALAFVQIIRRSRAQAKT